MKYADEAKTSIAVSIGKKQWKASEANVTSFLKTLTGKA